MNPASEMLGSPGDLDYIKDWKFVAILIKSLHAKDVRVLEPTGNNLVLHECLVT